MGGGGSDDKSIDGEYLMQSLARLISHTLHVETGTSHFSFIHTEITRELSDFSINIYEYNMENLWLGNDDFR